MSIKSESGRSMLEMIAVICVIIVLTMGALTGYQQIIASHQAISLNEDILVQAQAQKGHNYRGRSVYDSGIGKKTRMGLVMTAMNAPNGETFSIVVQNIPSETCAYLTKKDWKDAVRIKINDSIYTPQNMECASLKESGNKTFNLEVFFPKIMASVARFERTCDRCMSCERCDTTMDVCVNNCPESAQFCQDNHCVFSHCPKGKDLQNGNCVDCITNYACSSCAETSSTDVYWSGTDCMCYGDSCGQGFYCQASGTCASCPTNATCEEGFIVCNDNYYQVGEMCEPCPANATCEGGVMECTNENDILLTLTIESIEHKICCPKGQYSTDGKTCTNCATSTSCATCPTETPYWDGEDCVSTICPANSSTTETSEEIEDTGCYCNSGYLVNTTQNGCIAAAPCTPDNDTCGNGYYCNPDTNTCAVNACAIAHSSPIINGTQVGDTGCYCITGYSPTENSCTECTLESICSTCPVGTPYWNGISCYCPENATCTRTDFTCISPWIKNAVQTSCVCSGYMDGTECKVCSALQPGDLCPIGCSCADGRACMIPENEYICYDGSWTSNPEDCYLFEPQYTDTKYKCVGDVGWIRDPAYCFRKIETGSRICPPTLHFTSSQERYISPLDVPSDISISTISGNKGCTKIICSSHGLIRINGCYCS